MGRPKDISPAEDDHTGISRRGALECLTWAGAAVLWSVSGGVPQSFSLSGDSAQAAPPSGPFTFLQISDSHIGYKSAAYPDVQGTLQEAIAKIRAFPGHQRFLIHTGDITHLSKPEEFDNAGQIIGGAKMDVHYVPGEHDMLDEGAKAFLQRYGKDKKGAGWYSFDANGIHFIGLVNAASLKAGGMGRLGDEQLDWLKKDLEKRSASTPIVVFAHVPLWILYPHWGWGTLDGAKALLMLRRFGSLTILNGHVHQVMQKVEGAITFHTARSTAFPQPVPGRAAGPGPMMPPPDQLRAALGVTSVTHRQGPGPLAIVDYSLAKA